MSEADEQSISIGLYDRRAFLLGASTVAATVTSAQRFAPTAEVISVVPARRHETDIEGWNLGLLAPHRLERCGNIRKPQGSNQLWSELDQFGRILVRGCYVPFGDAPIKLESFLLRGSPEDSGNLKGFLRKFTRQNGCRSFIYKGYHRSTEVHHFRNGSLYGAAQTRGAQPGRISTQRHNSVPRAVTKLECRLAGLHLPGKQSERTCFALEERRVAG